MSEPVTQPVIKPDDEPQHALTWLRRHRRELAQLPHPAHGATLERWQVLADIARKDLSVARLAEGHADALSILAELGRPDDGAHGCWGVWAAEPQRRKAVETHAGWHLVGEKRWCSGSTGLDHALVTATANDGPRLFVVDAAAAIAVEGSWRSIGMAATRSETLTFDTVVSRDAQVGGPNAYVDRPGFWAGSIGVAACWFGGALGVADFLDAPCSAERSERTVAARGRVRSRLVNAAGSLSAAARWLDGSPRRPSEIRQRALAVRLVVDECARSVLDDVTVAGGASSLAFEPVHAQRVADLQLYLRQLDRHRAELELGEEPLEAWPW